MKFQKYFSLILIFLASFFAFYNLQKSSLSNWDEGLYAQIMSEFIQSPSLLSSVSGQIWLDKPPVGFWIQSLGMIMFGENNFGIRFVGSIFFVASILVFYHLIKKIYSPITALVASLAFLLCGALYHSHMIRTGDLEQIYLFFTLLGFWLYVESWKKQNVLWAVGLATGFAFMTRGYIAILNLGIIILHILITKKYIPFGWKRLCIMIGTFAAIVVPWHLYAYIAAPERFVSTYLEYQTISRVTNAIEGHKELPSFYISSLSQQLGWVIMPFFLGAIIYLIIRIKKYKTDEDILWLLWITVFSLALQLMSTKIYWYLIAVLPALYCMSIPLCRYLFNQKTWGKAATTLAIGIYIAFAFHGALAYITKPVILPLDAFNNFIVEGKLTKEPLTVFHFDDLIGPALNYQWRRVNKYDLTIATNADIVSFLRDNRYKIFITNIAGAEYMAAKMPDIVWEQPIVYVPFRGGEAYAQLLLTKAKQ